jgi:Zn-dependent protease/predicted transcriptional regulator
MSSERQPGGVDLLRVGGIQIGIDASWLIIFAVVLWSLAAGYFPHAYPGYGWGAYLVVGAVATVLFFVSIVVHELSHAVVANRLGQPVHRITLFIFGGMAQLTREPRDPTSEIKIASVGPLTSLAVAGVFGTIAWLAAPALPALWTAVFRYLATINVALAVFNLLPGFPLDGGRLARAIFWRRSGDLRAATARAANWGAGIALGLMVLGALQIFAGALIGGIWLILIGMFLRGAARAGYHGVVVEQALRQARVRDVMVEPVVVPPDVSAAQAIDEYFLRYGYGAFPVAAGDGPEGLVSLAQMREVPPDERPRRRVREIMRPIDRELCVAPGASASQALRQLVDGDSGRLVVVENGRLVGLITRADIMRFVRAKRALDEPPAPPRDVAAPPGRRLAGHSA